MTLILESSLRIVAVAAVAGLGLALFRVQASTVKLAVWRLVLYASLLMLFASLMKPVVRPPAPVARVLTRASSKLRIAPSVSPSRDVRPAARQIDWQGLALRMYALIAGLLLLRAGLGYLRLRQIGATATPLSDLGPELFETSHLSVPITYGIFHPRILLPADWHNWDDTTLEAVLAHERSHISERDFLTQCLSKINRSIYWANPLVWWLDRNLAQLAEHASDDAALHRIPERPAYAAMLLGFASRRTPLALAGVAMARHANVSRRIDRILDEARLLARPLSIWTRLALAASGIALVLVVSALRMPTVAAQAPVAPAPPELKQQQWWWSDRNRSEWALVTPNRTSVSGDSGTAARAKSLGSRAHGDYIWFTHQGVEYMIDDAKTLGQIEDWFKPIDELGRQQGILGEKQEVLGEQMGKLGEEMGRLGEQMGSIKVEMPDLSDQLRELEHLKMDLAMKAGSYQINSSDLVEQARKLAANADRLKKEVSLDQLSDLQSKLGELQAKLGEAQALAGEKQAHFGELQSELGEKQSALGEQQSKLGEEQSRLGEKQAKLAEEVGRKLERLFEQSVKDGRAKPVR